jgi:hypothetical protein
VSAGGRHGVTRHVDPVHHNSPQRARTTSRRRSQSPGAGAITLNGSTVGSSGAILTLGNITPGTGGNAPGTYNNVPLTGGSGTTATANITVSAAGTVSAVVLEASTMC